MPGATPASMPGVRVTLDVPVELLDVCGLTEAGPVDAWFGPEALGIVGVPGAGAVDSPASASAIGAQHTASNSATAGMPALSHTAFTSFSSVHLVRPQRERPDQGSSDGSPRCDGRTGWPL